MTIRSTDSSIPQLIPNTEIVWTVRHYQVGWFVYRQNRRIGSGHPNRMAAQQALLAEIGFGPTHHEHHPFVSNNDAADAYYDNQLEQGDLSCN